LRIKFQASKILKHRLICYSPPPWLIFAHRSLQNTALIELGLNCESLTFFGLCNNLSVSQAYCLPIQWKQALWPFCVLWSLISLAEGALFVHSENDLGLGPRQLSILDIIYGQLRNRSNNWRYSLSLKQFTRREIQSCAYAEPKVLGSKKLLHFMRSIP